MRHALRHLSGMLTELEDPQQTKRFLIQTDVREDQLIVWCTDLESVWEAYFTEADLLLMIKKLKVRGDTLEKFAGRWQQQFMQDSVTCDYDEDDDEELTLMSRPFIESKSVVHKLSLDKVEGSDGFATIQKIVFGMMANAKRTVELECRYKEANLEMEKLRAGLSSQTQRVGGRTQATLGDGVGDYTIKSKALNNAKDATPTKRRKPGESLINPGTRARRRKKKPVRYLPVDK